MRGRSAAFIASSMSPQRRLLRGQITIRCPMCSVPQTGPISMTGAIAPQLLQPRVAPAAAAVELVANRVLAVVVLMIFLGRIEGARHLDRRHDRLLEGLRFLERRLRGFRGLPLRIVVIED